jgi:hypothetical protein
MNFAGICSTESTGHGAAGEKFVGSEWSIGLDVCRSLGSRISFAKPPRRLIRNLSQKRNNVKKLFSIKLKYYVFEIENGYVVLRGG